MDKKTLKKTKTSVIFFFFCILTRVCSGGGQTCTISNIMCFKSNQLKNNRFQKRYLSRRDLNEKTTRDMASTHERRLGSVFCSAADEAGNTM